jgi:hypothetical protein
VFTWMMVDDDVPDNMSSCLSPFTTIKVVRVEVTLADLSKVFLVHIY